MASFQKVVDGLLCAARQADEVRENTLPFVHLSSNPPLPEYASNLVAAQFTSDDASRFIIIASDKTVDPHDYLGAWFSSFQKPVRRRG
ncbi:hypothetical protein VPNG_06289 [Cytospora leucostoma]|uniref:Uncharacterized protein n=1 Tax=Cytospora leucostoma TaxID=1230097 RepID=A0A423X2G0_9PEZI|nr:hypothetical protein VPNG_06289 [Cytospora leucostoma]